VETVTDELGLVETQKPVTGKRRRPRAKAGSKYKFVAGIKRTQKYKQYFDPERDIAMRLARFGDSVRSTKPLMLVPRALIAVFSAGCIGRKTVSWLRKR